ncbi:hypothetical protein V8G54_027747 [Vigna mungo]|uniref:Uncharacterized protein n=1 Tax=Vigna mungo TaxID=3915 RepID=A0AAQ3MR57_VIGMU
MASSVGTSPLLLSVGIRSQPEADVKHNGPNIVGLKPLPYNIRKGELKTARLQSSSYTRRAAALETSNLAQNSLVLVPPHNPRNHLYRELSILSCQDPFHSNAASSLIFYASIL